MHIKLAKSYGFCFGVKRAIEIAQHNQNSVTLGPLIHNQKEIDRLKQGFNVGKIEDISEIRDEKKVIIRTHGIPKHSLEELKQKELDIIDATCPYVTKPQKIVEQMDKEGYDIVIFGDINHPEIKGVKSYAKSPYVVLKKEELFEKKLKQKVAIVSQTTRKIDDFLSIVEYLVRHGYEVRVFNTICNATFENQDATKALAKEADVVIVVGGKNSSNTKQLYNIAKIECIDSYLVEDEDELEKEWFEGKGICGIAAGASTPDWIIDKICRKINNFKV